MEVHSLESLEKTKNDYPIISDKNHSFSIKIMKINHSLKIVAAFKDDILNNVYQIELSFEELKKINKYFLLYETIDEIYDDLILLMNKKQTKIFEENDYINIIIPLESVKIKEISFTIKKVVKSDKEIIQNLFTLIKELKQENKELKSRIINLESYIPLLEEYKTRKKEIEISSLNSKIINDINNYKKEIIKWIKQKTNKNEIKFEKIFTMSVNGSSSEDFHNYCDNKGPTLTLVKTTKNKIFGGFTPLNWQKTVDYVSVLDKNDETFIFSLNLMKKYDIIDKKRLAIQCNEIYGPCFGARDFSIEANMKLGVTHANSFANFLSDNNLELTGGKGEFENFDIEDFETFKVIY